MNNLPRALLLSVCCATLIAHAADPADNSDAISRKNLKLLAGGINTYTLLYDGKKPATLAALLEEGLVAGAANFINPATGHAIPSNAKVDEGGDYTMALLPDGPDLLVREKFPTRTPGMVLAIFKDGTIKVLAAPSDPAAIAPPPAVALTPTTAAATSGAPAQPTEKPAPIPSAASGGAGGSNAVFSKLLGAAGTIMKNPDNQRTLSGLFLGNSAGTPTPKASTTPAKPAPGAGGNDTVMSRILSAAGTVMNNPDTQRALSGLLQAQNAPGTPASAAVAPPAPSVAPDLLAAAQQALGQGNVPDARRLFALSLQSNPNNPGAALGLAGCQNALGELDHAISSYLRLQQLAPQMPNLRAWVAELYLAKGDLPSARRFLADELQLWPASAWAESWIGTLALEAHDQASAQAHFQRAAQLDPNVAALRYQNSAWMDRNNQPRRALMDAMSVIYLNPSHSGANYAVANAYAKLGYRDLAVQYYERYLHFDQTSEWAQRARGEIARLRAGR